MGTLLGHAFPGLLFWTIGFWNMLNTLKIVAAGLPFSHRFWYHCPTSCTGSQRPIEPIIKIVMSVAGVLIEMGHSAKFSIHDEEGNLSNMNDLQHSTMYVIFGLASVVDILVDGSSKLADLDAVLYFLAFASEGLMFYFHLMGRSMVDTQIHILLVLACCACAGLAILARWKSFNPTLSLTYALGGMTQGSWFIHAGFILYPPGDTIQIDLDDMESHMYVTDLFVMHVIFSVIILLASYFVMRIITPPAPAKSKQYVKHNKEVHPQMYKTIPTSYNQTKFYIDSD